MSYWVETDFSNLDSIPTMAGVYAVYDETGDLGYIGSSSDVRVKLCKVRSIAAQGDLDKCCIKYRPSIHIADWLSSRMKLTARLRPAASPGAYTWSELKSARKAVVPAATASSRSVRKSDSFHRHRVAYPAVLEALLTLRESGMTYAGVALHLNRRKMKDRMGRSWISSSVKDAYKRCGGVVIPI